MMIYRFSHQKRERSLSSPACNQKGVTLVELMVGMVVGALVATGILGSYITLAKMARDQGDKATMQINQRGSIEEMEMQLRLVGYDPQNSGQFGVTDVRRYSITNAGTVPALDLNGSPGITVVYDNLTSPNGNLDATDTFFSFRLFDENNDGNTSLARDTEPGGGGTLTREVLADNIIAIGFAYAYDTNNDRMLETTAANNVIWAVDTNNDNQLDFNLDTNDDGVLDGNDDSTNDNVIDSSDNGGGGALAAPVPRTAIRSVKIWILAAAQQPSDGYLNQNQYQVGERILSPGTDFNRSLKCQLMVRTVQCRNLL